MDWVGDIEEKGSVAMIRKALVVGKTPVPPVKPSFLGRLSGRKGYDIGRVARERCEALAAAEYVAAWLGHPSKDFPEKSADWVSSHRADFSADLAPLALEAVSEVQRHSELKLLWEEGDPTGGREWHDVLDDLKRHLQAPKQ